MPEPLTLNRVVSIQTYHTRRLEGLVRLSVWRGEYQRTAKILQAAMQVVAPSPTLAKAVLEVMLRFEKCQDQAARLYRTLRLAESSRYNTEPPFGWAALPAWFLSEGRFKEADIELKETCGREESNADARAWMALNELFTQRRPGAGSTGQSIEGQLRDALAIDPSVECAVEALIELGSEHAAAAVQRWLEKAPADPNANAAFARLHRHSVEAVRGWILTDPVALEAMEMLGELCEDEMDGGGIAMAEAGVMFIESGGDMAALTPRVWSCLHRALTRNRVTDNWSMLRARWWLAKGLDKLTIVPQEGLIGPQEVACLLEAAVKIRLGQLGGLESSPGMMNPFLLRQGLDELATVSLEPVAQEPDPTNPVPSAQIDTGTSKLVMLEEVEQMESRDRYGQMKPLEDRWDVEEEGEDERLEDDDDIGAWRNHDQLLINQR